MCVLDGILSPRISLYPKQQGSRRRRDGAESERILNPKAGQSEPHTGWALAGCKQRCSAVPGKVSRSQVFQAY